MFEKLQALLDWLFGSVDIVVEYDDLDVAPYLEE